MNLLNPMNRINLLQSRRATRMGEGIEAKPISGLTEDGPRRHYVEEFREQRIRVLTNYNVLTQGFDAPAVRAFFSSWWRFASPSLPRPRSAAAWP